MRLSRLSSWYKKRMEFSRIVCLIWGILTQNTVAQPYSPYLPYNCLLATRGVDIYGGLLARGLIRQGSVVVSGRKVK